MPKFIKVGRIYWIVPKPIPGLEEKKRPAIALFKYDDDHTVFISLGSSKFNEKTSVKATHILWNELGINDFRDKGTDKTYIHMDVSKPENNSVVIKPHYKHKYYDIGHTTIIQLRQLYHVRRKQLEDIRIKKAKIALINADESEAKKQLEMLKQQNPQKHRNLDINLWIKRFKFL